MFEKALNVVLLLWLDIIIIKYDNYVYVQA